MPQQPYFLILAVTLTLELHGADLQNLSQADGSSDLAASRISRHDDTIPNITIRVYDYANVPQPVMKRAQAETSRILRKAGVQANWVACGIPGQPTPNEAACRIQPRATDIHLNILPRKMALKAMGHHSEFGAAFPLPNAFGSRASVFYHRVDELAESQGASRALLLGHCMAHEIGHLLLGVNSHSDSGLMRVPWDRTQREKAYLGTLLFTEQEVQRIRREAAARTDAAQAGR